MILTVALKNKNLQSESRTHIHDGGLPPEKNVMPSPYINTVKPVYNDHLGDEVSVVVIDRWSL